jgi:cytochrome c biogenesis protein CcmG/thiol:disulfide interchange protein DsbE
VSRSRLLGLAAIVIAVVAALGYGFTGSSQHAPAPSSLAPLRAAAGLSPCPTGISKDLPKLTLACLGGGPPVALQGKPSGVPTLVNVYGSWCAPCQREMPLLAAFARDSAGRVALLGVDTEDEQRLALLFAKDVGQTWNAVVDDDKRVLTRYASGPPVTLFVDAGGSVVHAKVGAFKDATELRALTRQYLGVAV